MNSHDISIPFYAISFMGSLLRLIHFCPTVFPCLTREENKSRELKREEKERKE